MRARAQNQLRALWLAREKTLGDFARERREGRGSRVSPCSPESASAPGRVLLGEETARLLGDQVELEDAGSIQLKGVREPVNAYFLTEL